MVHTDSNRRPKIKRDFLDFATLFFAICLVKRLTLLSQPIRCLKPITKRNLRIVMAEVRYLVQGMNNYTILFEQPLSPVKKGIKALQKIWCCVAGRYYKMIWFYQLSWECKFTTAKSFERKPSFRSDKRANARNVKYGNSLRRPIYIINSVDKSKLSLQWLVQTFLRIQQWKLPTDRRHFA